MKKVLEYAGVYVLGYTLSFTAIQLCNDIFYKTVIKKENILSDNDFSDSLIPKSIFSKSAKSTFVKHKIEASPKDELIIYQDYIQRNKENSNLDDKLKSNIYDNQNKKI